MSGRRQQSPEKRRKPSQVGRTGRVPPLFSHALAVHSPCRHKLPARESPLARQDTHPMLFALRVLTCLVAMLAASVAIAQDTSFTHAGVQADAKRYETYLRANWQPGNKQGRELRAEGTRLLAAGADFRAASRAFAQAVVFDANDAEAWLGLARALLAIKPDQGSERYELPVNASGAAWNAYSARAGAGGQGGRAVGAARSLQAALLLASGHRRPAGWHSPQQDRRGAGRAGETHRRARLPHRRVQGRHGRSPAAAVHPVLRAAGAGQRSTGRSISRSTARTRRR